MLFIRKVGMSTQILNVDELTDEELSSVTLDVYQERTRRTATKLETKVYPEPSPLELGTAMFVNMTTGSEMYRDRTGLSQLISFQVLSLVKDQVHKELIKEQLGMCFSVGSPK